MYLTPGIHERSIIIYTKCPWNRISDGPRKKRYTFPYIFTESVKLNLVSILALEVK